MSSAQDQQRRAGGLQGHLENYSLSSRVGAAKATFRQPVGNWPIYAAATGSAVAMATSASAGIISYSGAPVTVSAPGTPQGAFSTVKAGAATFYLNVFHNPTARRAGTTVGAVTAGPAGGENLIGASGWMKNLASRAVVSAGGGFTARQPRLKLTRFQSSGGTTGNTTVGNWAAGVPGFEGFRFTTAGAPGQFHYGWARLQYGADSGGITNSVTLLGLAYNNTPGAPILTGQTSDASTSAPEPGTAGLMLLALGAAGVTVLRNCKPIAP